MERREPKQYVAPPWEAPAGSSPAAPPSTDAAERQAAAEGGPSPEESRTAPPELKRSAEERSKAELDKARVEAMLVQLSLEEPSATKDAGVLGIVSGAFVALIGLVMCVWGFAAFNTVSRRDGGLAGYLGAGIVVMFAVLFVVLGIWLLVRSLRQRGDI